MSTGEPAAKPNGPLRVPCLHNPKHGELAAHIGDGRYVWIDLEGPDADDLKDLADTMHLHPLTVEDARTFHQRPKIEDYDGYVFLVVFGVDASADSGSRLLREVHMILSGDAVVTIHHEAFPPLTDLRDRYHEQNVRSEQFLVYTILDAITSTFPIVLTRVDDDIDDIEQDVINRTSKEDLERIFSLKRDLVGMRRVVTPMRDNFAGRSEHLASLPNFDTDDLLYFRDLYDGLVRISDLIDSYRDLLSGAADMYLSQVANRQGEISKQLTIIATIFLPLSFLTGFWGQNFTLLTGHLLTHAWAFWVFGIGLLGVSVLALVVWFARKGWIRSDGRQVNDGRRVDPPPA